MDKPIAWIKKYDGPKELYYLTWNETPEGWTIPRYDWDQCPGTLHEDFESWAQAIIVGSWWGFEVRRDPKLVKMHINSIYGRKPTQSIDDPGFPVYHTHRDGVSEYECDVVSAYPPALAQASVDLYKIFAPEFRKENKMKQLLRILKAIIHEWSRP